MEPFDFEHEFYTLEKLEERRDWYINQVEQTLEFLQDGNKYALEYFRQYNKLLKKEFQHYNLQHVQKILNKLGPKGRIERKVRSVGSGRGC